ncbi:MAG TPA: T9SS type A sorting domain-containing protein, partial [Lentimicrobium sp.]|nr:T9SS type A sorting domain-containing protein [Lentimicrobium sp.]
PQTTLLAPEPNPAKNKVTVHYELQTASDVTLLISDINGKQVYNSGNFHRFAGTQRENINTTAFKSGTYIVTLITNKQKLTEKLVIAR